MKGRISGDQNNVRAVGVRPVPVASSEVLCTPSIRRRAVPAGVLNGVRALLNINNDIRGGEDGRPASHEEIPNQMPQDEHMRFITAADGVDTGAGPAEGNGRVRKRHSGSERDEGSFKQRNGRLNKGSDDNDDDEGTGKEDGRSREESESSVEEDKDRSDPWGEGAGEAAWGRCKN